MNKRFVTTLLATLLCVSSMFAFSACGGNANENLTLSKGEEVSAEEWNAAFAATRLASNATFSLTRTSEIYSNFQGEVTTSSDKETQFYKFDDTKAQWNTTSKSTMNGDTYETRFERYCVVKDNYFWTAMHKHNYVENFETTAGTDWGAYKYYVRLTDEEAGHYAGVTLSVALATYMYELFKTDGDNYTFEDLYSEFVYEDGYYVANFTVDEWTESEVKVAVKDGYLTGISCMSKRNLIVEQSAIKIISEEALTLVIKDYGKTSVTVPKDALKAIEYIQNNE